MRKRIARSTTMHPALAQVSMVQPLGGSKTDKKAHERATQGNVIFPENDEGNPNWVAADRLPDIFAQLLSDHADALLEKSAQYHTVGPCAEWAAVPKHVKSLLDKTVRVDRDVVLALAVNEFITSRDQPAKVHPQPALREEDVEE